MQRSDIRHELDPRLSSTHSRRKILYGDGVLNRIGECVEYRENIRRSVDPAAADMDHFFRAKLHRQRRRELEHRIRIELWHAAKLTDFLLIGFLPEPDLSLHSELARQIGLASPSVAPAGAPSLKSSSSSFL
jgi:hypothetical protein